MRTRITWLALMISTTALAPYAALAGQEARVVGDDAHIYELVDGKPRLLVAVPKGQALKISDQPIGEWYKCYVPDSQPPKVAWIPVRDVRLAGQPEPPSGSKEPPGGSSEPAAPPAERGHASGIAKGTTLSLLYDVALPRPANLQSVAGLSPALTPGSAISGQLLFSLSEHWSVGARVELLFVNGQLAGGGGALTDSFSYAVVALPLVLMAEYRLVHASRFSLGAHLGVGVSPLTSFGAANASQSFGGNAIGAVAPVGLRAVWWFIKDVGLALEAGYQVLYPVSGAAIGSTGSKLGNDLSSPLLGAGVALRF